MRGAVGAFRAEPVLVPQFRGRLELREQRPDGHVAHQLEDGGLADHALAISAASTLRRNATARSGTTWTRSNLGSMYISESWRCRASSKGRCVRYSKMSRAGFGWNRDR